MTDEFAQLLQRTSMQDCIELHDALRSIAALVTRTRAEAIAECAALCDKWVGVNHVYENGALVCAKAIRGLK